MGDCNGEIIKNGKHDESVFVNGKADLDENSDILKKLTEIEEAATFLKTLVEHNPPRIAIVCGSGFSQMANSIGDKFVLSYSEIPYFPSCSVPGHPGQLVFGILGGVQVVCMIGRLHAYEGHSMWQITFPIRVFAAVGVRLLIATNACGAINPKFNVGDLMIMKDHINLPGMCALNPLCGLNDERFGTRFPPMQGAYDKKVRATARKVGERLNLTSILHEGVYMVVLGPNYETSAELRMARTMGADVIGMSTAPEVIVARQCGLRCFGLSIVTNRCILDEDEDSSDETVAELANSGATGCISHADVLEAGQKRTADIQRLMESLLREIGSTL